MENFQSLFATRISAVVLCFIILFVALWNNIKLFSVDIPSSLIIPLICITVILLFSICNPFDLRITSFSNYLVNLLSLIYFVGFSFNQLKKIFVFGLVIFIIVLVLFFYFLFLFCWFK